MSETLQPVDTETATHDNWNRTLEAQDGLPSGQAPEVRPHAFAQLSGTSRTALPSDIDMIMDIPVAVTVELGRTRISIRELLAIAPGSVLELDSLAGTPLNMLVNGCLIARGEVVVVDDRFGIRLVDITSPNERLRKLRN